MKMKIMGIGMALCIGLLAVGMDTGANVPVSGEILTESIQPGAEEEIKEGDLYAKAAVLMDADSGRVLYSKNGEEALPMASTTKIMTCIVALENADPGTYVTVSGYAASMPDVQLNIREGEQYLLGDLLYSLMLESHNDAAVAIAELVGGSVEGFAGMMNRKAADIGCYDTYFVTPNGLDATATLSKEGGGTETKIHSTTAENLARIMSYCIKESPKKEEFLKITRTASYSFTNKITNEDGTESNGSRSFCCNNHNAFLGMMDGALSGKTGFTGNAGYCYVGALEREGKTFVVALLACGWPSHKTYKWSDTRKLMDYGLEQYEFRSFDDIKMDDSKIHSLTVKNGRTDCLGEEAVTGVEVSQNEGKTGKGLLMREDETVEVVYQEKESLEAPVEPGTPVGSIRYLVDGRVCREDAIVTTEDIEKIDFKWCSLQIWKRLHL